LKPFAVVVFLQLPQESEELRLEVCFSRHSQGIFAQTLLGCHSVGAPSWW
jgi:hypothetical protein